MHSAEIAFRNRHDALNVFPGSARPLLDAAVAQHHLVRVAHVRRNYRGRNEFLRHQATRLSPHLNDLEV